MSVDIVLDPVEAAAVVVQPPTVSPVQVASPGVVVIDNSDNVTISDDYILTIGA